MWAQNNLHLNSVMLLLKGCLWWCGIDLRIFFELASRPGITEVIVAIAGLKNLKERGKKKMHSAPGCKFILMERLDFFFFFSSDWCKGWGFRVESWFFSLTHTSWFLSSLCVQVEILTPPHERCVFCTSIWETTGWRFENNYKTTLNDGDAMFK